MKWLCLTVQFQNLILKFSLINKDFYNKKEEVWGWGLCLKESSILTDRPFDILLLI